MSSFVPPSVPLPPSATYGRGDLQSAFNWLVNQPEHIRKQASDPDRLMTLYYRSSGRPESETVRETPRIETEAPVSGQNFISDLRQINEAMRQFDRPAAHASGASPTTTARSTLTPPPLPPSAALNNTPSNTQALISEVKTKLNLSSDAEALNALVAIGYRSLKPLLG